MVVGGIPYQPNYGRHIDGFVQDCSIPSALAVEILQCCTDPIFTWHVLRCPSVAATPTSVGMSTMMATHGTVTGSLWPSRLSPLKNRVDAAMMSWKYGTTTVRKVLSMKHAEGFGIGRACFGFVVVSVPVDSCGSFTPILHGCFAGTYTSIIVGGVGGVILWSGGHLQPFWRVL